MAVRNFLAHSQSGKPEIIPVETIMVWFHLAFILLILSSHLSAASFSLSTESCAAELENKFLSADGKCPFSGLIPVKGSCTEYIPCISFGGEHLKPLKRTECPRSAGLGFDIGTLRCVPNLDLNNCPQKLCYSKGRNKQNQPGQLISFPMEPIANQTEGNVPTNSSAGLSSVSENEYGDFVNSTTTTNANGLESSETFLVCSSLRVPPNNLLLIVLLGVLIVSKCDCK